MNKMELQALYLSGTYCHKTGTGPPCYAKPGQTDYICYHIIRGSTLLEGVLTARKEMR